MDAVEAVRLQVMREAARAADAGDEHRLLRLELLADEQLFHRRENRVIATAGTPAGDWPFIVAEHVFAIVVDGRRASEIRAGEVGHVTSLPSLSINGVIASAIAPGRNGSPGTRVQQSTSTS